MIRPALLLVLLAALCQVPCSAYSAEEAKPAAAVPAAPAPSAPTARPGQPEPLKQFLPPAPAGQQWKIIWQDEFDGTKIDPSKWEVIGDIKRRDAFWVKADAFLDGESHLVLRTRQDGSRYTSGAVRTRGKFEHHFGYYECRCRFGTQPGHWPAFWLMSPSVGRVGDEGRDGTEIDIMEKPWLTDQINYALHWDGYGKDHKSKGLKVSIPGISQGWHTFGLLWKSDEYVFYIDGKETWRTSAGGVSQVDAYIKLTEEFGNWGGDVTKARLPDTFTVDYVRVFDLVEAKK